jgi:hypothetical protein
MNLLFVGVITVIFVGGAVILCTYDYLHGKREAEAERIVAKLKGIDLKRYKREAEAERIMAKLKGIDLKRYDTL